MSDGEALQSFSFDEDAMRSRGSGQHTDETGSSGPAATGGSIGDAYGPVGTSLASQTTTGSGQDDIGITTLTAVARHAGGTGHGSQGSVVSGRPFSTGTGTALAEPTLSTANVHAVSSASILHPHPARRIASRGSTHAAGNDAESVYSEMASSISNNFLIHFLKKENPLKTGGLGKEYWLEDASATKCFLCDKTFTTFRRKHHCRVCGQIFCGNCTLFIAGEKFNASGRMRVCKSCVSYAEKYDDIASSDESVAEDGGGEGIYPTRSNETAALSIAPSGRRSNLTDQDLIIQAPTPPPRMAIPATRHGAAVEIPSRNFVARHASSRRTPRRSRLSQSSHNFRSGFDDDTKGNLRFLQQLAPTTFSSSPNIFSSGVGGGAGGAGGVTLSPSAPDVRSVRAATPSHVTPSHASPQPAAAPRYSDDESEDEKSMSLYEALHDIDAGGVSRPPGVGSGDGASAESRARLSRLNSQTRSERAQASLWRMKNRKRSKTVAKIYSNPAQMQRSKTVIFENEPFRGVAGAGDGKRTTFDFGDAVLRDAAAPANAVTNAAAAPEGRRVFSLPNKDLRVSMENHCVQLLRQCLEDEGLDDVDRWERVLFRILKQIGSIDPDIRGGESFDIRQYVKLKRIPGASIESSAFVDGVVFSKNVALKTMPRELLSPQICLVTFPIEFSKSEQHFMSLELVMAQERESLHKLVGRIVALSPDILFVGDSISGLALEMLDKAGITVVYNMKPQVIERIAKMTDADVVTSIDKLAVNPKLGTCEAFELKQYVYQGVKRTYITLSGCDTANGGTIVIRGGSPQVLKKVKSTIEFMIYVFFNLNLEYALFRDEYLTVVDRGAEEAAPVCASESSYLNDFIARFKTRHLSSSSVIKFYLPPLLRKAREADEKLHHAVRELEELRRLRGAVGSQEQAAEAEVGAEIEADDPDKSGGSLISGAAAAQLGIHDDAQFKIAEYVLDKRVESLRANLQNWQRQWELFYNHSPYLLEPTSHQSLLFLYTMVNSKTTTPCVGPETLGIDFYWLSDISLGQYIEHISMTANGECPEGCGHALVDHYRSYVHGNGKVDVIVEPFQSRIAGLQNVILMWSYCKECRQSTPIIPMGESTWKYSFGKYLELSFWSENVTLIGSCPHDFKTHIRYFGIYNLAVRMEYSKVETLELVVPQFKLRGKPEIEIRLKAEAHASVERKATAFFDSIWERLDRVKVDSMTLNKMEAGQRRIAELKAKVETERTQVFGMADQIARTSAVTEHLALNAVIRSIQELSVEWDTEFQQFEVDFLPSEKDITRITSSQLRKLFMEKESKDDGDAVDLEEQLSEKLEASSVEDKAETLGVDRPGKALLGPNVSEKIHMLETDTTRPAPSKLTRSGSSNSTLVWPSRLGTNELEAELRRDNPAAGQRVNSNGKVKQLTSLFDQLHFDQISMEFELQRERERRKLIANRYRAIPVIASKPIVEVYKNVHDAVEEELSDDEGADGSRKRAGAAVTGSAGATLGSTSGSAAASTAAGPPEEDDAKKAAAAQMQPQEKASLIKTLTSFWADRSAALWKPLAYPLASSEHIFVDSDVIVREDEPSSLIAFCLSSSDYVAKLQTMRESVGVAGAGAATAGTAQAAPGPPADPATSDLERIMLKKTAIHLKYQFQEGVSILSCKIFFAEQFDAFRQQCGIDESFVQSLARCVEWDSAGGKSGSAFLKTLDDRFIIKELSHTELDAFVKFAPSYFEYLAQALFHDLPTVLAKIFGFYQIHIRNPLDNKNLKLDLLIMENLFYDRKTSRIFDLKGSMRNRHVEQTGRENEVLLDENMVEYIYESPLFVKEHAKKLLRTSLWNDTLFLSRMNVMDYSLVIGIDSENHELVVGIIDCIRTFTWDKKLESWVKEKGLVGGGGKEPTVVTPRQYKNRFRDAMDRYVLMVPDCWNQGPIE